VKKRREQRRTVADEFQRRTRSYHRVVITAIASWTLPCIAAAFESGLGFFLTLLFALVMLLVLGFFSSRYRCPACGAKPVDDEGDETWQPPAQCRGCGASLRQA
jgi:hypothetical protein